MPRALLAILAALTTTTFASAALTVGSTLDYMMVSGVRTWELSPRTSNTNDTPHGIASGVYVRLDFAGFELAGSYRWLPILRVNGTSPDADLFDDDGGAAQVVTNYRIREQVEEASLDLGFQLVSFPGATLSAGATYRRFNSTARIAHRFFAAHDDELGAYAALRLYSFDHVVSEITYRYASPPGRTLHSVGLAVGWSW